MPAPAPVIASQVEPWFLRHQRQLPWRTAYEPYSVWISEVMLQQTRMEVVLRHYGRFLDRFPTVATLAAAADDDVLAAWSGLGYYRRARMLAAGARDVVSRFGGEIPRDVEMLRSIAGIGRYTAGAIASIAFQQRVPIVDGNVARVLARFFAIEAPAGSSKLMAAAWLESERLVALSDDPRLFNQGLMEIGAVICTPRVPRCGACPLQRDCRAFGAGRAETLPLAKEKRVARKLTVPLYLIGDGTGRLLMRRERGALMTAMFHLPHGSTDLLTGTVLPVAASEPIGSFRHTITSRNVEFTVHHATLATRIADGGDEYAWVDPTELSAVPHPSYVAKAVSFFASAKKG